MKKILISIIMLTMCVFVIGCGKEKTANRNIPDTAKEFIWKDTFVEVSRLDENTSKVVFYCNANLSEASTAEYLYLIVKTMSLFKVCKVQYELYIDYSETLYHVNPITEEPSEFGIPDEWLKFMQENNIGEKSIEEFVTKEMMDTIDEKVSSEILETIVKQYQEYQDMKKEKSSSV